MALQQARTFRGISVPSAYIRVDRVFGGKRENWTGVVGIYSDASSAIDQHPLETFNFGVAYDEEQANPIEAVYLALKASSDFSSAVDC